VQDRLVEDGPGRVAFAIARLGAASFDHRHDVGQLALEPAKRTPVWRGAAPRFGQPSVVLRQTRQRASLGARRQGQVRAHEAAGHGVQLVAPGIVGGRSTGLQERRFEQFVQRYLSRFAACRQQRGPMGRRCEKGQGGQKVTRPRRKTGHRGCKHLAEDLAFGAGQALADALDSLAAAKLPDRPAG
jgi:hypothetical protein